MIRRFLQQLACELGFHIVDQNDLWRRKLRAARMGIDLRRGVPLPCTRCQTMVWR